jgi:NADH-quinone oxidoreductase subunit N
MIKVMYFEEADEAQTAIDAPADMRIMISVNAMAVLALGISPSALMAICATVFSTPV